MLAQHFLHCVLRNPLRVLGVQRIATRGAVHRVLEPRELRPGQAGDEHHVGRIVHPQGRSRTQLTCDTPAPQMLAGADVGRLGARRIAHTVISLDQQALDAALSQLDAERQAHGACANDQNLHRFHVSIWLGGNIGRNGRQCHPLAKDGKIH